MGGSRSLSAKSPAGKLQAKPLKGKLKAKPVIEGVPPGRKLLKDLKFGQCFEVQGILFEVVPCPKIKKFQALTGKVFLRRLKDGRTHMIDDDFLVPKGGMRKKPKPKAIANRRITRTAPTSGEGGGGGSESDMEEGDMEVGEPGEE